VDDANETKLSNSAFRKITLDNTSTDEEVTEIINSIYRLSNLVYNITNELK
jgi:hypothetical protein